MAPVGPCNPRNGYAFGQRIFKGVTDGSDREIDFGFRQWRGVFYRQVLQSAVRVLNQVLLIKNLSLPDRLESGPINMLD